MAILPALAKNEAIAEGVAFTQTLVAEPPNILTRKLRRTLPASCRPRCRTRVLDERQMKALGMGLLGVAQEPTRLPRLLAMRRNGGTGRCAGGVRQTFDTGGISLKPAPAWT